MCLLSLLGHPLHTSNNIIIHVAIFWKKKKIPLNQSSLQMEVQLIHILAEFILNKLVCPGLDLGAVEM